MIHFPTEIASLKTWFKPLLCKGYQLPVTYWLLGFRTNLLSKWGKLHKFLGNSSVGSGFVCQRDKGKSCSGRCYRTKYTKQCRKLYEEINQCWLFSPRDGSSSCVWRAERSKEKEFRTEPLGSERESQRPERRENFRGKAGFSRALGHEVLMPEGFANTWEAAQVGAMRTALSKVTQIQAVLKHRGQSSGSQVLWVKCQEQRARRFFLSLLKQSCMTHSKT